MSQILNGLQYLHNTAIICHCSPCPETLLLHKEISSLVIVEFGVSLLLPSKLQGTGTDRCPQIIPQGICCNLRLLAPEAAAISTFDGEAVDLFAAGAILFVIVPGFPL